MTEWGRYRGKQTMKGKMKLVLLLRDKQDGLILRGELRTMSAHGRSSKSICWINKWIHGAVSFPVLVISIPSTKYIPLNCVSWFLVYLVSHCDSSGFPQAKCQRFQNSYTGHAGEEKPGWKRTLEKKIFNGMTYIKYTTQILIVQCYKMCICIHHVTTTQI